MSPIRAPQTVSAPSLAEPPSARLPPWRLKTLLLALLLAVLLPSLGIGGYATWRAARTGKAAAEARLADTAAALALAVDREIGGYWSAAAALAASRSLDGPVLDLARFEVEARRVAQALGTPLALVESATLRQLVNTSLPAGTPPGVTSPADLRVVALTGRPQVTDLVRSGSSGHLVVGVAVPVERGGRTAHVLGVRLTPERLRQLLAAQALPAGAFASIADGRGVVVARSDELHAKLVGQSATAGVRALYEGRAAGLFRARTLDGVERVVAFRAVPAVPTWRVFVAEPASTFDAAWQAPLRALAAGGAALLLAALALAVLTARGVLRPVRELGRHAAALAAGSPAPAAEALPPAPVRELELLRQGFARAQAASEARSRALRESETRLRLALDAASLGTWRWETAAGTALEWDARCKELFGLAPDAPVDYAAWVALLCDEDRAATEAAVARALDPADPLDELVCDYGIRRPDGTRRWLAVLGRAFFEPDAAAPGGRRALRILGTIKDVTPRRRTEQALQRSHEDNRAAAERVQLALAAGAIIGTWMWELPTDTFTVDERFAESFGIDPALGRTGLSLAQVIATVHPDDLDGLRAAIDAAIARGGPYSHEYRVRGRDGVYHWIQANGRVELAADGTPLRFPGVLLDVGQRRSLEAERDQALALLRAFADAVPGVVYAKDRQGRMLVANRGVTELIGKPPEFFLGRTDLEFLDDPAQAAAVMANDRRVMDSGQAEQVEETVSRPGGEPAVFLSTKAPFRDAQGQVIGIIGASVDISARKAAEAALAGLNATLEQRVQARTAELAAARDAAEAASRAKSAFLAHMSHELRTPLNAVIGLSQLLQQRALAEDVGRFVGHIHAAGEQLLALVSDVLDLTRIESGEMLVESVPFEPAPLLQGVLEMVRPQADAKGLALALQPDAALPPRLLGDPLRLRQVLLNLLSNAVKFTAAGSVTLRLRVQPGAAGQVLLRLEVADTGIGIAEDQLARIFEPFTQADGSITRRFGGTGLGLSIVRRLVEMMGGSLQLASAPGQGSTFSVTLPLRLA